MSEVTTLKQLMLDAARYRWLRVHYCWLLDAGIDKLPEWLDAEIDERLNRE